MDTGKMREGFFMLEKLLSAWRARRVLIVGCGDALTPWIYALLTQLGARPTCIKPGYTAESLCRAMRSGRISALIVPAAHALSSGSLETQLRAVSTLLDEAREAGIPLTLFCSDVSVYRACEHVWYAREEDPIGGRTHEGLIQSMLQLYADGMSRGLMGDAVTTLIVRHMPCLGSLHPSTRQYTQWCRSLMDDEPLYVEHPARQGIFLHPLDVACGVLMLGARYFCEEDMRENVFNLGAGPQNLCANRSAALRFQRQNGSARPLVESEPPLPPQSPLLDGSRAKHLCGTRCIIPGDAALCQLLGHLRATQSGEEQTYIEAQTRTYLERIR